MTHTARTAMALSRFLDTGVTSIAAAVNIESTLREAGFTPFDGTPVDPGETRYLRLDGTILAFRAGTSPPGEAGMIIAAAHTDSPGLQLKHRSARYVDNMLQVPVEVYGSPILATWLDRDLAIAGRLGLRSGNTGGITVKTTRPIAVIPNLAIHLNREINENLSYNRQDHLQALLGPVPEESRTATPAGEQLIRILADWAHVDPADVLDAELNLVPADSATVTAEGLLISSRVDNLAGCYTVLEAIRNASVQPHTQVAVFYDHEEIGSVTAYGAAGSVTERFLRRLVRAVTGNGPSAVDLEEVLPRTILISNDAAHARHPNYQDKHDAGYAPILGGGPVIKKSAVHRYASSLEITTWLARIAERAQVTLQYLQNRSDIPAGSTIGPAVASRLSVRSVDIGIPILAMHSIRETGSVTDTEQMISLLKAAYGGNLDEVFDADPTRQV